MPLSPNTRLGRYEIRSKLGEGGMGEVYRAHDPKLRRDVAVKVLPPMLTTDEERLRRFEQEAQTLASLNHPNILSIIDVDAHDGAPYVVSELLEGETLREKLNGAPLPQRPAIDYALQIARGLAAAHDKGIVHRDLKPENIFITTDGHVKILDFGLAKLLAPEATGADEEEAPTRRVNTGAGTIMGTVGYMSPEQLRGQTVDHRSDIFSFGTVLYEMLAGRRAFHKDSVADTVSATLKEEPADPSAANTTISPAIEGVVRHCLAKNPEQRFQSARDLAFALEALSGISGGSSSTSIAPIARLAFSRERLAWIATGVMFLALLAAIPFIVSYFRRAPAEASVIRFAVPLPEKGTFYFDAEQHNLSVSPDGRRLVFVATSEGQRKLWLRSLGTLAAQALPGTEGAYSPFWSPDNRYIAFFAGGKLRRIESSGTSPQTICDLSGEVDTTGTWGRDGVILYGDLVNGEQRIYRVAAAGGAPAPIKKIKQFGPNWLIFFPTVGITSSTDGTSRTRRRKVFTSPPSTPPRPNCCCRPHSRAWSTQRDLLYAREGSLLAQAFDEKSLRLSGEPFTVVERLIYFDKTGWTEFSVSENGVLAYMTELPTTRLVWLDRGGRETGQIGAPDLYGQVRLSLDGQRLALTISDPRNLSGDLWVHDLARGTPTRFAFGPTDESSPVWSPDGRRLAYFSCCEGKSTLYIKDVGDPGKAQTPLEPGFQFPVDWSLDGRFILFMQNDPTTKQDLWVLPMDGDRKPFPFLQTPFSVGLARFSPDGRWVAFASNETGRDEVYVTRFDRPGEEKWRISTAGGTNPCWRRDGKELFFLAADKKLMAVAVKAGDTFESGAPAPLFRNDSIMKTPIRSSVWKDDVFDVTADGQRFIVSSSAAQTQTAPFTVVVNWTAELKK